MNNSTDNATTYPSLADFICALEQARVRALVERDLSLARQLHAPYYQLITPSGVALSRDSYLGKIAAGELVYMQWLPELMEVRTSAQMAVVRYQAELHFPTGGVIHCWHTDSYEPNAGRWQAVWSQATAIQATNA